LFKENGDVKKDVNVAKVIYTLYRSLGYSALYDTPPAMGSLLAEMNVIAPKFITSFAPDGIDFSRSTPKHEMRERILEALDKSRDIPAKNPEPFIPLPGQDMVSYLKIDDCSFPIHRIQNDEFPHGQWHLVLRDGSLVNATKDLLKEIEEHLKANKPINEIDLRDKIIKKSDGITPLNILDYINPTTLAGMSEEPRKQLWEGLNNCKKRGSEGATLLCLDQDEVTGLRMDIQAFRKLPTPPKQKPVLQGTFTDLSALSQVKGIDISII
jgi:hypothetical protein